MATVLSSEKNTSEDIPYFTYDDFKGLTRVRHGGHSIVKKGYYKEGHDSRTVVVKEFVVRWDKYCDREIQLLKGSSHPNIITIRGVLWDGRKNATGKPILTGYVMEYMELGNLDNRIYDFSKNNNRLISKWIQQIGAGLQYLHERNIIHRNINPRNILLASVDHVKLSAFGLARVVSGRDTNTAAYWIGTDPYRAPEVLVSTNYGPAVDVFSFGVTIWEIIHRKYPWEHMTTSKDRFGNDCVDLLIEGNKIHVNASEFLRRCWQTNIPDRPSIAEIIEFGSNFFLFSEKSNSEDIPYFTYDDFKGLTKVGHGGHSIVKKGDYKKEHDSRPVAVKEFVEHWDKYCDREIEILIEVGTIYFLYNIVHFSTHPNIIAIRGILWDGRKNATGKPILTGYVMEYMELGSLHNRIHDFSTNYNDCLISKWIQQIGAGLQYLHEKKVIHRDIKPKNILLASTDHLKLADFGLARVVSGRHTNTATYWIGTDSYMAPEVLVSGNYGYAADVFSFGVTIWEIIHRKHPWEHMTTSKDRFGNDCVDLLIEGNKIHVNASEFLRRCWQTNIPDRPSIAEIIEFGSNFEQINSLGTIIPMGHQLDQIQETITTQGKPLGSIDRTLDSISQNIVKKTILIMGGEEKWTSHTMTVLSTDRSDWIKLQLELPYDVNGAVFLHNELYVVGGQHNTKALYKLDENLEWKRLADMNVGREFIANSCLEANGYIWVFGGEDGDGNDLKSVERYDPKEDKWTLMPEMSTVRSNAAAVFWKDRIIVCGGWRGNGRITSSAECFLLETGEWTQFPPLPDHLAGHSLVSYENKLILMGGWNKRCLKSVWEMDPLQPKDEWKSLPPMKYCHDSSGLVMDQEIYAVGGGGDDYTALEIFDGKSWRDGPSLPYKRRNHFAVVIPQSLADRLCQYKP